MSITEVKNNEIREKEEAESIITSAKGIYAAVILKGRTYAENSNISDTDVTANNALQPTPPSADGSYYVWYWCPSVDGEYKTVGRSYERVNVPLYDERGKKLTYVVGDIIDISFDDGQLGAPRFVRRWGLVSTEEGLEVIKSNVIGIKTGYFSSTMPDALDLYQNQEGTPAFNLYPYLYRVLTGSSNIDDPNNEYYSKFSEKGDSSFYTPSKGSGDTASFDCISSRFTYSFLPFSSYFTMASGKESDLADWDPFEHEMLASNRSSASYRAHLEPYWKFNDIDNDITNIQNLIKYLIAVRDYGSDGAKSEATKISVFYTEPLNKAYWDSIPEDSKEINDEGYVPYEEFSRGPNSVFGIKVKKKGWFRETTSSESRTLYSKPILEAISPKSGEGLPLVKEAIRSYLTTILNVSLSKFTETRADNYFDALVYVSLYQYVRYFYDFSVKVTTSSIGTDTPSTKDIGEMAMSEISEHRSMYNNILIWAKELFENTDEETDLLKSVESDIRETAYEQISGYQTVKVDEKFSSIEDEISDKIANILHSIQIVYRELKSVNEKYAIVEGWLNLFKTDTKIAQAIQRLSYIRDMINEIGEEDFVTIITSESGPNDGSVGSVGELAWPVPYAPVAKSSIFSGFTGSKIVPTDRTNHNGVDISVGGIAGKPIFSATSGTVFKAVDGYTDGIWDDGKTIPSAGNHVIIIGDNVATLYAHCQKNSVLVKTGDTVSKRQEIACVGTSGYSTGYHLHFEVRPGTGNSYWDRKPVDPLEYYLGTKASTSSPGTGSLSGNAKVCAEVLKNLGLNNAAVAGILGNIEQESGFNPAALSTYAGDNYYGLFQCGPYISPGLLKAVPDWKTNISGQINYVWNYIGDSLRNAIKNVSNDEAGVKIATERFLHGFEKPCQEKGHPHWPAYYECVEFKSRRFPKAKVHFNNLNK